MVHPRLRPCGVEQAEGQIDADYRLSDPTGAARTVALTYPWARWLDGPDPNDPDRPAENPGAKVVTLLERGDAEWAIVTNGKLWRLYSRAAHSRSTNFYEVDLQDALVASGQTDPNEAFRYWWLFFRQEAFAPAPTVAAEKPRCWLDTVAEGSRDYAREVEQELKRRVFYDVVPMLASGFIHDRRARLKKLTTPTEEELEAIRSATLTLLYRLLFMLYAESRDLLPVRESVYYAMSLKRMKEEIRSKAGDAPTSADEKIEAAFCKIETTLYERLADPAPSSSKGCALFRAMASGYAPASVPKYNGGLFRLDKDDATDDREAAICDFLNNHRVPDYYLASAIDRLSRVEDKRAFKDNEFRLEFVDYKSLGVRQLGSIYEGLLEFKLRLADEDLTVKEAKGSTALGSYIPLAKARGKASKKAIRQIKKGEPILQRDNTERKSSGAYYTPDHIVQYIVENTVGPVLARKLEALRPEFRSAEQSFHRHLSNVKADPRIMLGHAAAAPLRARRLTAPTAKPQEADFRAYALAETHTQHKDLVERLFDMKVLDPAMGSGHFLVEAVDFITDELLDFLNAFPNNPVMGALGNTRDAIMDSLREQGIETDDSTRRQLTDIHLLKRHVLKRCIYGVDLNPLATELAKVSLWLDAFTLGAPLSFLDHHLRTGNSLIGSSILELERVLGIGIGTQMEMHAVSNEPILRAVKAVLDIARYADASAMEVADSRRRYDEFRRALSPHRVLMDILVAKHFGHADAPTLLKHGGGQLKLETLQQFLGSLGNRDRKLVEAVITLAKARHFFHWDLEFPEVYYAVAGYGQTRVERRAAGDAGFDAIVGNPPWGADLSAYPDGLVRTATGKTCSKSSDSYAAFLAVAQLRCTPTGCFSFVTPDTFLRKPDYTELRRYLLSKTTFLTLAETGPLFVEVPDVWCAILVVANLRCPHDHRATHLKIDRYAARPSDRLNAFATKRWWRTDCLPQVDWLARPHAVISYWTDPKHQGVLSRLDGLPTLSASGPWEISRGEEGSKTKLLDSEVGQFSLLIPEDVWPYWCASGRSVEISSLTPGKVDSIYSRPKVWVIRIQKMRWVPRLVCALDSRSSSAAMKTLQSICVDGDRIEDLALLQLWLSSDYIELWATANLSDDLNQAFLSSIPCPPLEALRAHSTRLLEIANQLHGLIASLGPVSESVLSLARNHQFQRLRSEANGALGLAAGFSSTESNDIERLCAHWREESADARGFDDSASDSA